jgi:hypothetical protein
MLYRLTMACAVTLLLAGCGRTMATGGTEAACSVWRPISWSGKDTDRTIEEVKLNNARRAGFCR